MPRHNTDILLFIGPSGGGKTSLINELRRAFPSAFSFSVSHTTRQPRPGERDGVDYHFVTPDAFERLVRTNQMVEYSTLVPGSPSTLKNNAAPINDRTYGTSKAALYDVLSQNKVVLMDTDVEGALNILEFCRRHSMAELRRVVTRDRAHGGTQRANTSPPTQTPVRTMTAATHATLTKEEKADRQPLRCQIVFVSPPDLDTLEKRLKTRGTETPSSICLRMDVSARWIDWANTHPEYINYRLINDDLDRCAAELNTIVQRDILTAPDAQSKL